MYELVRQIWEEERIPEEWKETIIIPAAHKILSNIISGKIKPYIEKVMGDYQNGVRDERSVTSIIFALKISNEKHWEYNQSVQYLFIDFQKTYDSIRGRVK